MANYGSLGLACVFAAVGLLLIAVSFATDHWIVTTVDRADLEATVKAAGPQANSVNISLRMDQAYFSRNRGLFRTCYEIGQTPAGIFLDGLKEEDIADGNCVVERGYEIDGETERVKGNDDYDIRVHLMRAHFAFFIIAMLLVIVAVVCGAVGCWKYSTYSLRIAAGTCIASFLCTCAGMAFFHGYEYLEKEKINQAMFPKYYLQVQILKDNTKMSYGYSYVLGWVGAMSVLVGGILFICVAWSIRGEKKEKKQPFDDPQPEVFQQPQTVYQPQPQPMYQPQPMMMAPQPQMMAPPQGVVTPVPSMYGGYGPRAAPAYAPAPSMFQGYGY